MKKLKLHLFAALDLESKIQIDKKNTLVFGHNFAICFETKDLGIDIKFDKQFTISAKSYELLHDSFLVKIIGSNVLCQNKKYGVTHIENLKETSLGFLTSKKTKLNPIIQSRFFYILHRVIGANTLVKCNQLKHHVEFYNKQIKGFYDI